VKKALLWRIALDEATPHAIAASIALGLVLGVFPVYGAPTLLCTLAALLFRPHVPLLQAINMATSPLQFALLVPFHNIGARILPRLGEGSAAGKAHVPALILGATAQTIAGWLLVGAPAGVASYCMASHALRRRRLSKDGHQQTAGCSSIRVSFERMFSSMFGIS